VNDFAIEVGSVSSRRYEEFLGTITDPPTVEDRRGIASAPGCRAIGNEAILALPTGRRASRWSLNSDANHNIQARASRKSLNGEFSGSRCDRIFLNAAVWSEDVQRPARRGNGSPYSCWPAGQRSNEHAPLRCTTDASITNVPTRECQPTFSLVRSTFTGRSPATTSRR